MTDWTYHVQPADAGQLVSVAYAVTESGIYRRTIDSDGSVHYDFADFDSGVGDGPVEPWNGRLPDCDWTPVAGEEV